MRLWKLREWERDIRTIMMNLFGHDLTRRYIVRNSLYKYSNSIIFLLKKKLKSFMLKIPYMSIWCFFLISNANKLHFMFYWFTLFLYCATDCAQQQKNEKKTKKYVQLQIAIHFWVLWTFSCLVHSSPFSMELQYFISLSHSKLYFLSIKHHFGIRSTNDKHLSLTGGSQKLQCTTLQKRRHAFFTF